MAALDGLLSGPFSQVTAHLRYPVHVIHHSKSTLSGEAFPATTVKITVSLVSSLLRCSLQSTHAVDSLTYALAVL